MGFSFLPNGSNDHKNFEANLLDYGLKCLTETKIQILCYHVNHTSFHIVEMGCQMVQLLSAHIVGPTMSSKLFIGQQRHFLVIASRADGKVLDFLMCAL